MLTNIYGAPYDKSNPNATWGVPLKLSEEVIDIYYSRNTVGEVYASIESDLKKASNSLSCCLRLGKMPNMEVSMLVTLC